MPEKMNIMIVDDEKVVRESFLHWFEKIGHTVEAAASGEQAMERLAKAAFDLMFVDIKMPGMDGIELLERVKADFADTDVVIITAYGSIETAIRAMQVGAADYLLKPFKPDQLTLVMEKVNQQRRMSRERDYLKGRLERITRFDNIIGRSTEMEAIFDLIMEVAASDASVLLTGETGTGKELIAKAIHAKSSRAQFPFIAINCGAVPDSLLGSELFGHQKGAFTGAVQSRQGFLEVAAGGSLFLDEIGEISPKMQIDLLRVLEEKKLCRIGSSRPVDVNFRLISATRRDLAKAIDAGTFRRDFYYRINVIRIDIPPLRKRKSDIPLLVEHFLEKYSHETAKHVDRITSGARELLMAYDWPGNVRELENVIERAVVLSKTRSLAENAFDFLRVPPEGPLSGRSLKDHEKAYMRRILSESGWNVTRAAAILDIHRTTLHKKIKRYGLERDG
jgi:two-component system response regulator HydG